MSKTPNQRIGRERRSVRYTLLLTPDELVLAQHAAMAELRSLPDFFRVRIHLATKTREEAEKLPQGGATS